MSAEAITELAVVDRPEAKLSQSASIEEIGARLALVKRALQEAMEEDVDFGKIPPDRLTHSTNALGADTAAPSTEP